MMQPFYDHESDDMKISFAQLVGYLDFYDEWALDERHEQQQARQD